MKLATYQNGQRDGRLMIVSRDNGYAMQAPVATLQALLDDWQKEAPACLAMYAQLNEDPAALAAEAFVPTKCLSPLPRAYQWADGSAYLNHVELVRKARGATVPESFWHEPLMYQGGSDTFIAPNADVVALDEEHGVDFEAEVVVITDSVAMAATTKQAGEAIRLLTLVNDVSLRNLIPNELAKGFGFFVGKPSSAFAPIAVTPDELGSAWQNYKLNLEIHVYVNEVLFGKPNAGVDMAFSMAQLVQHAAKTRALAPGSIVGSGTISNKQGEYFGSSIADGGVGYCCIAELRTYETLATGKPITPYMCHGDRVKIEMLDEAKRSIFGAIDQAVVIKNR